MLRKLRTKHIRNSFLGVFYLLALLSPQVYALSDRCPDLWECVKVISEMTGKKYFFSKDLLGQIHNTENLKLTKGNADQLLGLVLKANKLARVPLSISGAKEAAAHFEIVSLEELPFQSLPALKVDRKKGEDVLRAQGPHFGPYDYLQMEYQAQSTAFLLGVIPDLVVALSRYGEIRLNRLSGQILVRDNLQNLKGLYHQIQRAELAYIKAGSKGRAQNRTLQNRLKFFSQDRWKRASFFHPNSPLKAHGAKAQAQKSQALILERLKRVESEQERLKRQGQSAARKPKGLPFFGQ